MATRALSKLNTANRITISPADFKNIPDFELFFILNELKLIKTKTGNVPRANASIVRPPDKKPPVVSVYNCID